MAAIDVSSKDEKKTAVKLNIEMFDKSIEEFNRLFPDRDSALVELKKRLGDKATKCRECGEQLVDVPGARELICTSCRESNWVTADTPFENMKSLTRAWLAAIWLRERGVVLTSPRFATALHCSISAAQNILKKHGLAILKTMEVSQEAEIIPVYSAEFLDIYRKRSQDTPRRQHPSTEQAQAERELVTDEIEDGRELTEDSQEQEDQNSPEQATQDAYVGTLIATLLKEEIDVLNLLNDTTAQSFDQLMVASSLETNRLGYALGIFEIEGVVKRLPGDRYLRIPVEKKKPVSTTCGAKGLRQVIDDFIEHIKTFSHGISRKTVQLYFAIYWYYRNREALPEPWLSKTCLGIGPISDSKLLEFVSPLKIQYWKIGSSA